MRQLYRTALSALILTCLTPDFANSTQILARSPEQLGATSTLVVRGRVAELSSFWNESETKILTEVEIEVDANHKGQAPTRLRVLQMGGVVGNVKMTVAGSLVWNPGEDVLLFLEDSLPNRFRVAGFSQGKFTVERDATTGELFVRQASLGAAEIVAGSTVDKTAQAGTARMPLQSLLNRALPLDQGGR